jgi:hypothetical protein
VPTFVKWSEREILTPSRRSASAASEMWQAQPFVLKLH